MAVAPPDEITMDEDDLSPLVDAIRELTTASSGWINLSPEVEPGFEPPPRRLTVAIFSARGEAVPMATWKAPEEPGKRATIGIEHGSGPKALERLAAHEVPIPSGWIKVADHPRRGFVATVPADADPEDVAWWLLAATHVLSVPPLTGSWLAKVYPG